MSHNWSACAKPWRQRIWNRPSSQLSHSMKIACLHEFSSCDWDVQSIVDGKWMSMMMHDVKWCWWSWIAVIDTLTLPASTAKMLDCFDGDYPDPLCVNTAEDSLSLRCVAAAMHGRLCFCFTVMHCPISSDNWFKAGIVETGMTRRGVCVCVCDIYIYIYE